MQLPASARRPGNGDDSLIPLINVVFLMLVFFMIAGKITATDLFKVQPPTAQVERAAPLEALVILIDADGRIAVDGVETPADQLATRLETLVAPAPAAEPATAAAPAATAAAPTSSAAAPSRKVAIKADGGLKASQLNDVLDALRAAGVANAELFTVRGGPAS